METITYGVDSLIDWHAEFPIGNARLCVHFTGGTRTRFGALPARYTTSDPVVQQIINKSYWYKSGLIRVVSRHGTAKAAR